MTYAKPSVSFGLDARPQRGFDRARTFFERPAVLIRKLFFPVLTNSLLFALAMALGFWQVARLHWKEGLLTQIAWATQHAPVPLGDQPAQFTKVIVSGQWDSAHVVRYGVDERNNGIGSYVIEPLLRPGKPALLVDLGYAPEGGAVASKGAGSAVGYVRNPDHPHWWSIADDLKRQHYYTLNPQPIAKGAGIGPVENFVLVAMGDSTATPEPSHGFPELPNNHLQYAITWFSLALVDVIMFTIFVRKTMKP